MKNLFDEKGVLEIVIGRGAISAFEISALSEGDEVAVSDRDSGDAADIVFNGQMIASAEVMFLEGGLFGARLIEIGWSGEHLAFPGTADDVIELLEFRLRIASVETSLGELRGAGTGTIVNFGVSIDSEDPVELMVAGTAVARGEICRFENKRFGMRIRKVLATVDRPGDIRTTGSIAARRGKTTSMDHQLLLDRYTRNQIMNVSLIHERFCANLRHLDEKGEQWHVTLVDQVSFRNLIDEIIPDQRIVCLEPARRNSRISPEEQRFFIQPERAEQKIDAKAGEAIAEAGKTAGESLPLGRILFAYTDSGVFAGYMADDHTVQEVIKSLRNGWKLRYSMAYPDYHEIRMDDLEADFTDMDHMLIVRFEHENTHELVTVVYPTSYVARIAGLLE